MDVINTYSKKSKDVIKICGMNSMEIINTFDYNAKNGMLVIKTLVRSFSSLMSRTAWTLSSLMVRTLITACVIARLMARTLWTLPTLRLEQHVCFQY